MPCSCQQKKPAAPTPAQPVRLDLVVRADGNPLACERCLRKHLAKALVYAAEAREEDRRDAEAALCVANLACAAEHADALGDPRAATIAALASAPSIPLPSDIRPLLGGADEHLDDAVGLLAVAEDALRFAGRNDIADSMRGTRLSITP